MDPVWTLAKPSSVTEARNVAKIDKLYIRKNQKLKMAMKIMSFLFTIYYRLPYILKIIFGLMFRQLNTKYLVFSFLQHKPL